MPLGKCTKYSFQNWKKTAYQTSSNRSKNMKIWSIWWCLVCRFFSILKWIFCTFFPRVLPTKLFNFHWFKMDPKNNFFIRYTLEENKINKSFKIEKKRHTKHHQIDQKTWKFDRFDDVWYAVFFQFWNFRLSYFLQGYGKQNKYFWRSILSQWKINNFVGNTLEESNVNTSFKIGQKRHTKHHKIDQIFMFFDRFDNIL